MIKLIIMTILKILQYPDPKLRRHGQIVTDIKSNIIQNIIDDMLETLKNTESCAGLSATQLDIDIPPSITVINEPTAKGGVLCLINPEIIESEGQCSEIEGCMSIHPEIISAIVNRPERITVTACDREGQPIRISTADFLARCIQHEIDHLHGIVYIDRISPLKKTRIEKKISKLLKK